MTFHVLTIFPEFFAGPFEHGVVARAKQAGLVRICIHNLRDWTSDRHKTVDDRPFGGGEGMLLKPEPVFSAVESIWPDRKPGDPDRKVAVRDLIEDLDSMAASASHIPDEEMDALIDEAIRHVRHRRS